MINFDNGARQELSTAIIASSRGVGCIHNGMQRKVYSDLGEYHRR